MNDWRRGTVSSAWVVHQSRLHIDGVQSVGLDAMLNSRVCDLICLMAKNLCDQIAGHGPRWGRRIIGAINKQVAAVRYEHHIP